MWDDIHTNSKGKEYIMEKFMIDVSIEIDAKLLAKIDKQIQADESIPQDEKDLWNSVHLYPETLCKHLEKFLKENYGNKR